MAVLKPTVLALASINNARWRRLLLSVLGLASCLAVWAETAASREYQLKAVFLFNFAQFVQWPEDAFEAASSPLVIGVLGDDPFAGALDEVVAGETVRGHPIVVRHFSRPEEARSAHVLFVSESERLYLSRILSMVGPHPVLTVSDLPGFARRGGIIAFYFDGTRLRFEINPRRAQDQGLQLSSQLLSLARIPPETALTPTSR